MKTIVMIIMIIVVFTAVGVGDSALSSPVLLGNIAAYDQGPNPWCTFVSAAELFSYWDMHGYPNLFAASTPDIFLTNNVWPEVLEMVDLYNSDLSLYKGFAKNIVDFAGTKGYAFRVTESDFTLLSGPNIPSVYQITVWELGVNPSWGTSSWIKDQTLTSSPFTFDMISEQIDKGFPLIYGSNPNDPIGAYHDMPVFGYDVRPDGNYIAYYTNWYESETVLWKPFNPDWISSLIMVEPIIAQSVPEPATLLLLGSGLVGLMAYRRRFKK